MLAADIPCKREENNDQDSSSCYFWPGARFRYASNAGLADAQAAHCNHAGAYGLWRRQGHDPGCLPVQSWHTPGAPSNALVQIRTADGLFIRSLKGASGRSGKRQPTWSEMQAC